MYIYVLNRKYCLELFFSVFKYCCPFGCKITFLHLACKIVKLQSSCFNHSKFSVQPAFPLLVIVNLYLLTVGTNM
jgi:hypothetical protein